MAGAVLVEPGRGIRRGREKQVTDAVVDLIAAWANARADSRDEVVGFHALVTQRFNRRVDDTGGHASPSSVNRRDGSSPPVGDEDRHAIGDADDDGTVVASGDNGVRILNWLWHEVRVI